MTNKISHNFLGVWRARLENSKVIILPVPYEGTVTYRAGTSAGPSAIIEASKHIEFFDNELNYEPYVLGIHTLPELSLEDRDPNEVFNIVLDTGRRLINKEKLIIMLGGEHSITPGMVCAFSERYNDLSVLQLDAHADLRNEYYGTKYNHACVMRRVLEFCPIVQVGIRSISFAERRFTKQKNLNVFFMHDIRSSSEWMDRAIEKLSENVYVSIDLDVFDPSIMPSVGTPEPGGMFWDETSAFLRKVAEKRTIIGADIVELSPIKDFIAPDFLAAKLVYKLIGYAFLAKRKDDSIVEGKNMDISKEPLYVLQITDSSTKFRCAMKIDPENFSTFRELMDRYVKVINPDIMTPESAKYLSIIQDCIYNVDDNGNLTELFDGLIIRQVDDIIDLDDEPAFELTQDGIMLLDLIVDRSQITEEGNPYGYNIRKWQKNKIAFEKFVRECLEKEYGSEYQNIIYLTDKEDKKKFLWAIGKKIWESDFELYSRFIGDKLWFKDPAETLLNIIAGRGGTCAEKASAMKLISDVYGLKSEYILAGAGAKGPLPVDVLRKMLQTLNFEFGKKYMVYWQHIALLYDVDGEDILIDVSNGNIPFLFLTGYEVEELLRPKNKRSVKVKMVSQEEEFYYHITPQDIPETLLSVMQDWVEYIDMIHVFEDGLGLLITKDYFVWPVMYRNDDEKLIEYNWWIEEKEKNKFKAVELLDNFSLPGPVVNEFREKYPQKFVDIIESADYLAQRYNEYSLESKDDPKYYTAFMFIKL